MIEIVLHQVSRVGTAHPDRLLTAILAKTNPKFEKIIEEPQINRDERK